jgi:hypothetical protein
LSFCWLPDRAIAQSDDEVKPVAPIVKPIVKPVVPVPQLRTNPNTGAKPTAKTQPAQKPQTTTKPRPDAAAPSTTSDPDTIDPNELIRRNDAEGDFEILKGSMPCLDSTAACITQLTQLAIANNPTLKSLTSQIDLATENIKTANAGSNNIFRQIQPFLPIVGVPLLGIGGGGIGAIINTLGGNSRTDQTTAQTNADLQIKVGQLERTKLETTDKIKDSVAQEVIRFDELRLQAETSAAIANREASRFKVLEVGYRLGQGDTASFLDRVNALDRVRIGVSADKGKMRSQAVKVRRIVLGDDA